jgi:hypothetical protein
MTEPFDNTQSYQEGWYFYHALNQVRRTGSPAFASTEAAIEYVRQRAAEGSVYHLDALARVAFAEPPDRTFNPISYLGEME